MARRTRPEGGISIDSNPAPPPISVASHALFLDIDGTLLPFAPTPSEVRAEAELNRVLGQLATRMGGAIAVITGRTVSEAERLLSGSIPFIAGVHGRQWRTCDGQAAPDAASATMRAAGEQVRAWIKAQPEGVLVEDKEVAIALHYRLAPRAAHQVRAAAEAIARDHRLRVLHGEMVSEILQDGPSKGEAVRRFMARPEFAGRAPIVVGDDITDEDAFLVAERQGGCSVLVGRRRPSAARFGLPDVPAVHRWLEAALEEPRA